MQVAVIGAGAMGSLFGALLHEAGHRVWLLDIREDHLTAIDREGLHIEQEGQWRTVRLQTARAPGDVDDVDLIVVFVKSGQTEAAAKTAAQLAEGGSLVLTLQNGMGNAEKLALHIDPNSLVAGTTAHGATVLGPGKIRHAGEGPTILGLWRARDTARLEVLAGIFSNAGIKTSVAADIKPVLWEKLLINVGINAITALTGIHNGELLDLEATRELAALAVTEAAAVASAKSIAVRNDIHQHVFAVARATADNRSSMGQDIDHCRPTEIEAINGLIVKEAEQLAVDVPVNRTLTALISTLQAHYPKYPVRE